MRIVWNKLTTPLNILRNHVKFKYYKCITVPDNLAKHVRDNEKQAMVVRNRCKNIKQKLKHNIDLLQKQVGVHKQNARTAISVYETKEKEASVLHGESQRLLDRAERWEILISRQVKILTNVTENPSRITILSIELKRRMVKEKYQVSPWKSYCNSTVNH